MRMTAAEPATGLPRRELEDATLTHGGRLLAVTVLRQAGKRLRPHKTVYLVERRAAEAVDLVKDDGQVYTVTALDCTCPDTVFVGRLRH